jgi:hypothetical protein
MRNKMLLYRIAQNTVEFLVKYAPEHKKSPYYEMNARNVLETRT